MKKILLITIIIILNNFAFSAENSFKDVSRQHWAYYAIENLINKEILEVNSDYFNGEVKTTKNDLVFYLSKILNKLDEEKADKDDLLVIENLIYEFSNELNEFGIDIENYKSKIDNLQNEITPLNDDINNNTKEIKNLKDKLSELNKNNTSKNVKNNTNLLLNNNRDILNINFKSEFIKNQLDDSNLEGNSKYEKSYRLELKYKEKNNEIILVKSKEVEDVQINAKAEKEILDNGKLYFHLGEYRTDISSYTKTLNYNNYNQEENRYTSNNLMLELDNVDFISEDKNEKVNFLFKTDNKYIKTYYHRDFEEVLNNYELTLVYPNMSGFKFLTAYVNEEKKDENKKNYKYAKLQAFYEDNKKSFLVGYAHKLEEESLYNNVYGEARYEIIENGYLKYDLEVIDSPINTTFLYNNRLGLENETDNLKVSFEINKISIEKDKIKIGIEDFKIENYEYTELMAKVQYNVKDKYGIKMSYLIKDVQKNGKKETLTFIKPYYRYSKDINIFIKYLEKDYEEYNDNQINMDGDYYNLNYDIGKGISENGNIISLGIEMKF